MHSAGAQPQSVFVCGYQDADHSACSHQVPYGDYEGKRYCIFHFPGTPQPGAFRLALERKIAAKKFDFRGFRFSDNISFKGARFPTTATFRYAVFAEPVDLSYTVFARGADFRGVLFQKGANFTLRISRSLYRFGP
jgi:hypothetical protein